ncbi:MAG: metallophosphoesterase [Clostridia bacterium]|nr:metallophosphoesterase [Clostridia bacterium]
MRIGLYADPHYAQREMSGDKRYNRLSLKKIKECYGAFAGAGAELAVCLGDLVDNEPNHETEVLDLTQVADIILGSNIPTVCVMGNHDAFSFTAEEYYSILRGCEPKDIHALGLDLLFLDSCFFKSGIRYAPGDRDWRDTFLPHPEALEEALKRCTGDVYIFMHQNLDPEVTEVHRLFNAREVMDILEKSGKVKAVYQGHYHPGHRTVYNGIEYISLPAMCEKENAYEIIDI